MDGAVTPHPALADLPPASGTQQSWFHHGDQVLALLETHKPKVIVELGTWRGASAIAMARVARAWGGVVYCVDTWCAGPAASAPTMLAEAAGHMVARGVSASLRLIPATTLDAAAHWTGKIDCLYVDADHTYESVAADLAAWWPHLKVGGLIAGDDYRNAGYPGVERAWDEFEAAHKQRFSRRDTPNTNPPGMALIYGVKQR